MLIITLQMFWFVIVRCTARNEYSMSQDPNVKPDVTQEPENEVIDKKAYQAVAADMHKYKSELKQYKEQLNAIKADKEAAEKQSLLEQEKWKELFNKNEASLKQIQAERDSERNKFLTSHKINNVVQELE